jgi:hypothetical protein
MTYGCYVAASNGCLGLMPDLCIFAGVPDISYGIKKFEDLYGLKTAFKSTGVRANHVQITIRQSQSGLANVLLRHSTRWS